MSNEISSVRPNPYIFDIENRRKRKPRLAHDLGAGAKCNKCGDKCPGFELHFWRKICMNCRCGKDDHEVEDEEEDIGKIVIGKLFDRPPRTKKEELEYCHGNHLEIINEETGKRENLKFDWVPPNIEKSLAARYMALLPPEKRPVSGSEAAKERRRQLEQQLPLYDMDAAQRCDNMPAEELQCFHAYLERIKTQVAGQGQVQEIVGIPAKSLAQPLLPQQLARNFPQGSVESIDKNGNISYNPDTLTGSLPVYGVTPTDSMLETDNHICTDDQKMDNKRSSLRERFMGKMIEEYGGPSNFKGESVAYSEQYGIAPRTCQPIRSLGTERLVDGVIADISDLNISGSQQADASGPDDAVKDHVGNIQSQQCAEYGQQTSNPSTVPTVQSGTPGQQNFMPGQQGWVPGHQGYLQGQRGFVPGQKGFMPCQEDYAPCEQGLLPGQEGNVMDKQALMPGQLGYMPDKQGLMPGQEGYAPSKQDLMPGQEGYAPSKQDLMPGQEGYNLGKQGLMPGQEGYAPNNQGLMLGQEGSVPGKQGLMPGQGRYIPEGKESSMPGKQGNMFAQQPYTPFKETTIHGYQIGVSEPTRILNSQEASIADNIGSAGRPESSMAVQGRVPVQQMTAKDGNIATVEAMQAPYGARMDTLAGKMSVAPGTDVTVLFPGESQVLRSYDKNTAAPSQKSKFSCQYCSVPMIVGDVAIFCERAGQDKCWHPACFCCYTCKELLADLIYFYKDGKVFCGRHFTEAAEIPRCKACDELIFGNSWTRADGFDWHIHHFCCNMCDTPMAGQRYVPDKDGYPYCLPCYMAYLAKMCETCEEKISPEENRCGHRGYFYHANPQCFQCYSCKDSLLGKRFKMSKNWVFCSNECIQKAAEDLANNPNPREKLE
ncbi:uncharacterized protein [Panulirus ornatus]